MWRIQHRDKSSTLTGWTIILKKRMRKLICEVEKKDKRKEV